MHYPSGAGMTGDLRPTSASSPALSPGSAPLPPSSSAQAASPYSPSAATSTSTSSTNPLRASPSSSAAFAGATKNAMAASPFLPQQPSFRPSVTSQSTFAPLSATTPIHNPFDRDPSLAVGAPFGLGPPMTTSLLIRRLPLNTSEESMRLMLVFSKDLADVKVLPAEQSEDAGFRCAVVKFKSFSGAQEAKNMLDGKPNISNDAEMIVEMLGGSPPPNGRRYAPAPDAHVAAPASTASSATSSATSSRQPSRFNGAAFGSLEAMSPPMNASYGSDLSASETSSHFQSIFSPQSPIGNHLTDRSRMSGKTLIKDAADDDETGELLKDPVAYAENGALGSQSRRAPAPQVPLSRMAGLSLNTNSHSIAPYGPSPIGPMSAHPTTGNTMSPTIMTGASPHPGYMSAHPGFARHHFPPVNPADQNPPCNTLYVGNLPIDTSEEELKATFSKQRGYKRLCFRTKQNGPMCFVEFEDVSFATKALHDLYGHMLHNSVKGGIRLSFSKNPLGVRSGQNPTQSGGNGAGQLSSMNGIMAGASGGFATTSGPPPGLSAPPGLGGGMGSHRYAPPTSTASSGNGGSAFAPPSNPWNSPMYGSSMTAGGPTPVAANGGSNGFPSFMMGR